MKPQLIKPASVHQRMQDRSIRGRLMAGIRRVVTPEARSALKNMVSNVREQLGRACLWRWQIAFVPPKGNLPYRLVYIGRRVNREQVLMQFSREISKFPDSDKIIQLPAPLCSVLVGDLPIPGSLRVPAYVHAVVQLNRSIDEIAVVYGDKLRRVIRQQKAHCEIRHAVNTVDIDLAEQLMLRPYAIARYGQTAAQIDASFVRQMALKHGRLDVVYQHGEPVSCHLGFGSVRGGKRYWNAMRFGFTEAVFSNPKRLHEINSVNIQIAVEWAMANGFDYYDIGMSVAQPDDGLLQWKRRRGGHLDTGVTHSYFQVRLPKFGTAQMLWNSPLFDDQRGALTLHLGLPANVSDEQAIFRYREMGFGGLVSVCVHHARPPGETLLIALRQIFSGDGFSPTLKTMLVQS